MIMTQEPTCSDNELMDCICETSTILKKSRATIDSAMLFFTKKIEVSHIKIELKHKEDYVVILKTCSKEDIDLIDTLSKQYATADINTGMNIERTFIKHFGLSLKLITAWGTLERALTRTPFETLIDRKIVAHDKTGTNYSYKCFAKHDHRGEFGNAYNIVHENAASSWNCLISTKLKYYEYGYIYKRYND